MSDSKSQYNSEIIMSCARNIQYSHLLNYDRVMLRQNNINSELLPDKVKSVTFTSLGKVYHGVGLDNINGGFDAVNTGSVYPKYFHFGNTGMVFVKSDGDEPSEKCCVFADLLDYFSFLTIQGKSKKRKFYGSDCFILSDSSVFIDCASYGRNYKRIYCFFPKDDTGNIMYLTLRDIMPKGSVEKTDVYDNCYNLQHYLEIKKREKRLSLRNYNDT